MSEPSRNSLQLASPLHAVLAQMGLHGGNFVRKLADLTRAADLENRERLIAAFPEIFERYDALAGAVPIPADFGPSDNGKDDE